MASESILAIDTATEWTSVCVAVADGTCEVEEAPPAVKGPPGHSVDLLSMIERCVAKTVTWKAIDRIVVGVGPGLYTGLRIGIMSALALGRSTGVRVSGITSLAALAASEHARAGSSLATLIDARRGEVFGAEFTVGDDVPKLTRGPFVAVPDALAEFVGPADGRLALGSGAWKFRSQVREQGFTVPDDSTAHRVRADLHARVVQSGAGDLLQSPEPLYLRPPDARRWLDRDRTGPKAGK